ncbi:hypothetical protein [Parazoarcus communis]|uniref:DUF1376 domain-containing protein n=1 Tax=Parazoarcus communis SWub3 = DSM 12120 TaxID=1121029 RepID=A0A323UR02_9RHOO|nr:hypothetical protein [Parazoarcus communis]NMG71821.1 hypothetical protein [Parazoarcus communis SWub3 = DSM 12120]PZA14934.1 hypothetical protein DNK49_19000 [Azoarcus communis] [Parazoarcus communis SWub3 = DSM 12120]
MANQWFRLYAEFATDPKVQMMSEADQRRFIMVLCLRCANDDVTLHDEEVAFQLRISDDEWARTKARFLQKGLIHDDNTPTAWERRQFISDSSAERVRRHREKKKKTLQQAGNVTETPPEADTDTEADTEVLKRASTHSDSVGPVIVGQLAQESDASRRAGQICRRLRESGMSDAAVGYLPADTWAQILALRTDDEIVEIAMAKRASRPNQRTGLKYVAPALLEPPQPISAPNARASPGRMSRDESRAIAASTRLSDFRAACAADANRGQNDERTIEAPTAPRQLG